MHYFPFLGALAILQAELKPTADPVLSSPEYRRDLAVNLLYKVKSFFFNIIWKTKRKRLFNGQAKHSLSDLASKQSNV